MIVAELEKWMALEIAGRYHQQGLPLRFVPNVPARNVENHGAPI
jgi:hypothetical protein